MAVAAAQTCGDDRDEIIVSAVEHSSVGANAALLGRRGYVVREVPVAGSGRIDLDQLASMVTAHTALVSVQSVNNETGVVQPVAEVAEITHRVGALYHCDAAQALGKIPILVDGRHAPDLLSVTAHKINGPTGCGALYARDPSLLQPLVGGGDQEQGLRGGTENLLGAVGFGVAAAERMRDMPAATASLTTCRDTFERTILAAEPQVTVNGDRRHRVGQHVQSAVSRHRRYHAHCSPRRPRPLLLTGVRLYHGATDAVACAHRDGDFGNRSIRFSPILFRRSQHAGGSRACGTLRRRHLPRLA